MLWVFGIKGFYDLGYQGIGDLWVFWSEIVVVGGFGIGWGLGC